jgi:K(+)-stimulated pyrophosphate-energized sodium pump
MLLSALRADELEHQLPPIDAVRFAGVGGASGTTLLWLGLAVCLVGMIYGLFQFRSIAALPVHRAMGEVAELIWQTCATYLWRQGRFLVVLWSFVAGAMLCYFLGLRGRPFGEVVLILGASVLGILGSYAVAWFGIRINTIANARTAFSSLRGDPLATLLIPLRSGMSIGVVLVCVELALMLGIVLGLPRHLAMPCFVGFAIGESLGASALRIGGGIFTKIADIGADLMKLVFDLPEDDPRNPGVIADCTGDNAGDSVGPTADAFETYGVTSVALLSFLSLALAATPVVGGTLMVWLFIVSALLVVASVVAYELNGWLSWVQFDGKKDFDFERPLTNLIRFSCLACLVVTFGASWLLLGDFRDATGTAQPALWWLLSAIISCGTLAGAIIPEFTKFFTSTGSAHVREIVTSSRHGGASLNILSGFVAGNFSAFWKGLVIVGLMFLSSLAAQHPAVQALLPDTFRFAAPIFAFGLVAFGFLAMGPVTIAVDSFGPVADNAQSVYELSRIESLPGITEEIERDFHFIPDFANAKHQLEKADGAGNTFKATAKPVLIGTAVVGATTMIFGIIMLLQQRYGDVMTRLSLVQPGVLLGLLTGGAVVYWFTGASTQAVVTGAYRAVVFIKENLQLGTGLPAAHLEDSKRVVDICTLYAQRGMVNIFAVLFTLALALPFFDPFFFIGFLIGLAFFGLYQAIFMANAGGAWDNAKKYVEVDLREKGTPLHAATVVGDTVGDPFKDTSSVSLNPVIKFTTLFGLLAVEIAVHMTNDLLRRSIGVVLLAVALCFVHRSFYAMRIPEETAAG